MIERFKMAWATVRDGLWFVPGMLTLAAAVLALALVDLEQRYQWELGGSGYWLLTGGVEGSRQVLGTIAGSLITVTGVVFSVTIVALQLASSQFTPRILRNFIADRVNQVVLGVFISTFTYTLLVLRVIRSPVEDDAEFVPHAAVAVAIILALLSIGCLIYFVHHVARSISASVILSRVTAEALAHIERLFPQELGVPEEEPQEAVPGANDQQYCVAAEREGYLQAVNGDGLFNIGREGELLIRMAVPVGGFVVEGQTLAKVWASKPPREEVEAQIGHAFIIGEERTPEQDFEFCVVEIVDIAVKALSPGINDPTTALHSIDRLTQILVAFGKRHPPSPMRTDAGHIHFEALHSTFEGVVELAFNQIRYFGGSNPAIASKLRASCDLLEQLLPVERHPPVERVRRLIDDKAA
jgi:uncharacterized membrane protein